MGENTIPDEASPSLESFCLVHPGVRDKRRVSETDLSQPRHETAFWWRHNGGREREIKFISLFEDRGHRGPYSPYKPCNHNLHIGIIIFPHIDNPQSTGYN